MEIPSGKLEKSRSPTISILTGARQGKQADFDVMGAIFAVQK